MQGSKYLITSCNLIEVLFPRLYIIYWACNTKPRWGKKGKWEGPTQKHALSEIGSDDNQGGENKREEGDKKLLMVLKVNKA